MLKTPRMLHHYVRDTTTDTSGDHWAAGISADGDVFAQLQADGEQVRLKMSAEHAEQFARALLARAEQARARRAQA